jgi:hypothetical protein
MLSASTRILSVSKSRPRFVNAVRNPASNDDQSCYSASSRAARRSRSSRTRRREHRDHVRRRSSEAPRLELARQGGDDVPTFRERGLSDAGGQRHFDGIGIGYRWGITFTVRHGRAGKVRGILSFAARRCALTGFESRRWSHRSDTRCSSARRSGALDSHSERSAFTNRGGRRSG